MKVVSISDTVSLHDKINLPSGDVLTHSGDVTYHGNISELEAFLRWFRNQDFEYKIFIGGDHDSILDYGFHTESVFKELGELFNDFHVNHEEGTITYLEHSKKSIWGVNFFGSPYTYSPSFCLGTAFKRPKGMSIMRKYASIPRGTDILLTHEAPIYTCDFDSAAKKYVGSPELRTVIKLISPKVSIFGNIREGYGISSDYDTLYINAASFSKNTKTKPIVFDIDEETKNVSMNEYEYPTNLMVQDIM